MKKLMLTMMLTTPAYAGSSATIGVSVRLISCQTQEEIMEQCYREGHCCQFVEPASGDDEYDGYQGEYDEESDTWITY